MADQFSVIGSKGGNKQSKPMAMILSGGGVYAAATSGGKVDSITTRQRQSPNAAAKDVVIKTKPKPIVCTKSIENLKLEKYLIFNKMTMTQERIIQVLDELRLNLLDIQMSEGVFEKSKLQKNAFDFCVRFSRNFLYPLKVMIDRVCQMTPDSFNSACSNDACHFVSAIYTLIYQSLRKYQRQLRYFLLEQVPQKLSALIEMINTLTTTCLDKGVFDPQDAIVECIQERCSMFTNFIQEMQEERFLKSRDNFRKLTFKQRKPEPQPNAHLSLKMRLNGMNMYEPQVELKQKPGQQRPKRLQMKWNQLSQKAADYVEKQEQDSDVLMSATSNIKTQIEDYTNRDVLPEIPSGVKLNRYEPSLISCTKNLGLSSFNNPKMKRSEELKLITKETSPKSSELSNLSNLKNALTETVQMVTKNTMQQALEPFIESLGCMFEKKKDVIMNNAVRMPSSNVAKTLMKK